MQIQPRPANMSEKELFNISESLREDTSNLFLNQPPQHMGDSCCEEEIDGDENELNNCPGEPFINKLQRNYKVSKSVPIELLSTLSLDGMRHLIEILINDTLTLKNLKEGRKTPTSSDSESENYRLSHNFSTNSISKQPTFPLSRPLASEELKMRRNNNISTYQKIEIAQPVQEIIPVIPISVKIAQTEHYDQAVLKIYAEIAENKNVKNMLFQLIRLSPSKLKIAPQANSIMNTLNKHKQNVHTLIQELGKIKIYSKLMNLKRKKNRKKTESSFKPEEAMVLNTIVEAFDSQNLKNFREYAYGLMKEYEANEVTMLLVRHAGAIELNSFGDMLFQIACLKQVLENQEGILNEMNATNEMKKENLRELQNRIKNLTV